MAARVTGPALVRARRDAEQQPRWGYTKWCPRCDGAGYLIGMFRSERDCPRCGGDQIVDTFWSLVREEFYFHQLIDRWHYWDGFGIPWSKRH